MISKFIVLVFCVSSVISDDDAEYEKLFEEKSKECVKEFNINPTEFEAFLNRRPMVIGEGSLKCYPKCVLQGMMLMNGDGHLIEAKGFESKPGHVCFARIENAQKDVTDDAMCEKAFNFFKCVTNEKEGRND